jgi:hypothetical protein
MRFVKWLLAALIVAAVVVQFVPLAAARDNPPATATITGPPEVVAILRAACFDCHSNETHWPLYAYVAPSSWLVVADVAGGRSRMNFSEWEDLRLGFQKRFARKIVERVEAGEMPLWQYRLVHGSARLSTPALATLRNWRDELNGEEQP